MKSEIDVTHFPRTSYTLYTMRHLSFLQERGGAFVHLGGWALQRSLSLNDLCFQQRTCSASLSGQDTTPT